MKRLILLILVCTVLRGDFALMRHSGGVSWHGSTRVFVGHYTWPADRKPLSHWSPSGSALQDEWDHHNIKCDAVTNVCTATGHNLPNGTEVKFGTTGRLPSPLVSWDRDQWKAYYVRDSTVNTFALAAAPGGAAIDITDTGSGTHGMSFAGYHHILTIPGKKASIMTCDPATDICTAAVPHGYAPDNTTPISLGTTGTLPGGLTSTFESDWAKYCAAVVDDRRFKLRLTGPTVNCSKVATVQDPLEVECGTDKKPKTCFWVPGANWEPEQNAFIRFSSTGLLPLVEREGETLRLSPDVDYQMFYINKDGTNTFRIQDQSREIVFLDSGTGTVTVKIPDADITDPGTGVHSATYKTTSRLYIHSISGYPAGTTFTGRSLSYICCLNPPLGSNRLPTIDTNTGSGTLIAKVPAISPAGDYPVTIRISESDNTLTSTSQTISYTLKAMALEPLSKKGPASYPELPTLDRWERLMTSTINGGGGGTGPIYPRCPDRANPVAGTGNISAFSISAKIWYYDGAANFYEISRWPFNFLQYIPSDQPEWKNCGEYVAKIQRDLYLRSPGASAAYEYHIHGMYLSLGQTGDPRYKVALRLINDKGQGYRGNNDSYYIRENALSMMRRLRAELVNGQKDQHLQYYASSSIGHLLSNIYGDPERLWMEPFIGGLMSRPLVEYYLRTHDERVPVVLKAFADKFWRDWYDPTTSRQLYNPEPYGSRCTVGCAPHLVDTQVNNFIAPVFWFVWRLTGDELYRQRGDELFASVWRDGWPYDPKQWNQAYWWGFEGVRWRLGKAPVY